MAKTATDRLILNLLVATAIENTLQAFIGDRALQGRRPATVTYYRNELQSFARWAGSVGARDLTDITPDVVRAYLRGMGEHRNATGVHTAWRALRAWLRWAWVEYELPGVCPVNKVKLPTPKTDVKPAQQLTDVDKLLRACTGVNARRDKALIMALLDTGIRRRECSALDVGDLATDGAIRLRADGTKTGHARSVFLSRPAQKALRAYLADRPSLGAGDPLFTTADGGRLTGSGIRQILRRLSDRAGLPEVGSHSLRRTFAIETLRAGADVVSVSKLLGHSDLSTTRRYLPVTEDDLRKTHEATSPVDRLKAKVKK